MDFLNQVSQIEFFIRNLPQTKWKPSACQKLFAYRVFCFIGFSKCHQTPKKLTPIWSLSNFCTNKSKLVKPPVFGVGFLGCQLRPPRFRWCVGRFWNPAYDFQTTRWEETTSATNCSCVAHLSIIFPARLEKILETMRCLEAPSEHINLPPVQENDTFE